MTNDIIIINVPSKTIFRPYHSASFLSPEPTHCPTTVTAMVETALAAA